MLFVTVGVMPLASEWVQARRDADHPKMPFQQGLTWPHIHSVTSLFISFSDNGNYHKFAGKTCLIKPVRK